jgi:AraC-like DNA-binding protein
MSRPSERRKTRVAAARTAKKPPRVFTHAHRQRLDRAADHYLRDCYRQKTAARASEFASQLGLTPEYISAIAPQILGKSLRDFLRDKQLAYAARLLGTLPATVTVEEIAVLAAFGTVRTFHRCFRDAYGTAPGAFRGLKK